MRMAAIVKLLIAMLFIGARASSGRLRNWRRPYLYDGIITSIPAG